MKKIMRILEDCAAEIRKNVLGDGTIKGEGNLFFFYIIQLLTKINLLRIIKL